MAPPVPRIASQNYFFFWREKGGGPGQVLDASAIPESEADFQKRYVQGNNGPWWAQLVGPCSLQGKQGAKITLQVTGTNEELTLDAHELVPKNEGLYVLDAMSSWKEKPEWFSPLEVFLRAAKSEQKAGVLKSSIYFLQKILEKQFITGPSFGTPGGVEIHHRRMDKDFFTGQPEKGVPGTETFEVESLQGFMPAWEAFVHPKCGLYQDFYLVHWAAPYDKQDFSQAENGSDKPGCTWEPDQSLPWDLDQLRLGVRRQWCEQRRKREQELEKKYEEEKVQKAAAATAAAAKAAAEPPSKKRRFNDECQCKDVFAANSTMHGFALYAQLKQESDIKNMWPKHPKDFPPGYGSAEPPGYCTNCNCMEDWHLGQLDPFANKAWIYDQERDTAVYKALDAFTAQMHIVSKRGAVSKKHYLEAVAGPGQPPNQADAEMASLFSDGAFEMLRHVAKNIPFYLFADPNDAKTRKSLVTALTPAFSHLGSTFGPQQYRYVEQYDWMQIDPESGEIVLLKDIAAPRANIKLSIKLANYNIQHPQMIAEMEDMDLVVDVSLRPQRVAAMLKSLFQTLNEQLNKITRVFRGRLHTLMADRLLPVFDSQTEQYKDDVSFIDWVSAVNEAACLARLSARSHVIWR